MMNSSYLLSSYLDFVVVHSFTPDYIFTITVCFTFYKLFVITHNQIKIYNKKLNFGGINSINTAKITFNIIYTPPISKNKK